MRIVGVIPVRYGATRLPGKPLADIGGWPLVRHVWERAQQAGLDRLVIATDDQRILKTAREFGAEAVLTSPLHRSGTDRAAEAVAQDNADIVVNIQGDEPLIPASLIDEVAAPFVADAELDMATAATEFVPEDDPADPNVVKVVCDLAGNALYFSRAAIPFPRQQEAAGLLKHVGIYAYRAGFLKQFAAWEPTPLELTESLEQLRALEHGVPIRVVHTDYSPVSVDTPADLERVRALLLRARGQRS